MAIAKITKGRNFAGILYYVFVQQRNRLAERETKAEIQRALDGFNLPDHDRAQLSEEGAHSARSIRKRSKSQVKKAEILRGEIIATNMAGRDRHELGREFAAFRTLRPGADRVVGHCSISTPEQDRVTTKIQGRIAERFAGLMGLARTAWVAVRHKEHGHDEFHFIYSRVNHKGRLIPDSKDYERAEEAMRKIEVEFNLTRVAPSREAMRRSPTQAEFKVFETTKKPSFKMELHEHIDAAIGDGVTAPELVRRLEERGVDARLRFDKDRNLVGISFRLGDFVIRGKKLGAGYTAKGLQKVWEGQEFRQGVVTYDIERDYAACCRRGGREDGTEREGGATEHANSRIDREGYLVAGRDEREARAPLPAPGTITERRRENERATSVGGESAGRIEERSAESDRAGVRNTPGAEGRGVESARSGRKQRESPEAEGGRGPVLSAARGESPDSDTKLYRDGSSQQPFDGGIRHGNAKRIDGPVPLSNERNEFGDRENQGDKPPIARANQETPSTHDDYGDISERERRLAGRRKDSLEQQFWSGRTSDQQVFQRNSQVHGGFEDAQLPPEEAAAGQKRGFSLQTQARDEDEREWRDSQPARPDQSLRQPEMTHGLPESTQTQLDFDFRNTFEVQPGSPRCAAGLLYGEYLVKSVAIAKKERETGENQREERVELNSFLYRKIEAQEEHRARYGGDSVAILSIEQKHFIEENLSAVSLGELRESIQQSLAEAVVIGESPIDHPLEREAIDEPTHERIRSRIDDSR